MSRITNDILGMMGRRALAESQRAMHTALERLATGKRINRASDDPAGMAAVQNLSVQAKRAEREIASLERTHLRLDATEGGLGVVSDLLVSLQSVVVQAANTGATSKGEREALQVEADSIIAAINHVSTSTTFDGEQILRVYHAGGLGTTTVFGTADGGDASETHSVSLADLAEGKSLNLLDGDLETAQKAVQAAVDGVARSRGALGTQSNSNRSRIRALFAEFENTMAARSAIEDTDFAREASELVRTQILGEASIRTILIGRQQAAGVLGLL